MRDVHKQAEDATKLAAQIGAVITMFLLILSLSWLALRGDDIRAHRMGMTVEQLHSLEDSEARIEAARALQKNGCDYECYQRIGGAE